MFSDSFAQHVMIKYMILGQPLATVVWVLNNAVCQGSRSGFVASVLEEDLQLRGRAAHPTAIKMCI